MEKLLHRCVTAGGWKSDFYNDGTAISKIAGVSNEYCRISSASDICYELFDFWIDELELFSISTCSEIYFPKRIYRGMDICTGIS